MRKPWWTKIRDLAVAGVISLTLSLTWIFVVALTPASARPYVGGTYQNNPFEMVFGYNGLGRFTETTATAGSKAYRSFTPPFSGTAGVFRLFSEQLAGQIAWLLPAAIAAVVVLLILRVNRALVILLGVWLLTMLAMFSAVAGMHQFYTSALAIPIALLVAIAIGEARRQSKIWPQIVLVLTAAVTAVLVGLMYLDYFAWLPTVQLLLAIVAVVALIVTTRGRVRRTWWVTVLVSLILILTPAVWAVDVISHPNSINPVAGSGSATFGGVGGARGGAGGPGGLGRTGGGPGGGGYRRR